MKEKSNKSRREFFKSASLGALTFGLANCHTDNLKTSKKNNKPNILVIWTDEQRADTMKAYGNHHIHSPNLDKLANQSIVFENAYVSQSVCTPARSTVMTGLWPHQNECLHNNIPLESHYPTFPELVNDPEYHTGYFGKWHLGDEIFVQHGFDEWESIEDMYIKHYSSNRDRSKRSTYHHWLLEKGYKPDNKNKNIFSRQYCADLPLEHCKPKFLEEKTIDFLRRQKDTPFMLYVNFLEPHMPFSGPLNNEHKLDEVVLPENYNDPFEEDEPQGEINRRSKRLLEGDYRDGHNLESDKGWKRLLANYWGLVTQVDLSVGAIMNELDSLGLAENTIVVYTSDHGDMMGSHKCVEKGTMYEEAVKVPWLMRIPQFGFKQKKIKNRVSQIDLVPTLGELINKSLPATLPGKSLVPLIKGKTKDSEDVFIEWNPAIRHQNLKKSDKDYLQGTWVRTVISKDGWKLCLRDRDKNQLYNLNEDPFEFQNLYYAGDHTEIIADLTDKILSWQDRTDDLAIELSTDNKKVSLK